jgi:hypothetical protein
MKENEAGVVFIKKVKVEKKPRTRPPVIREGYVRSTVNPTRLRCNKTRPPRPREGYVHDPDTCEDPLCWGEYGAAMCSWEIEEDTDEEEDEFELQMEFKPVPKSATIVIIKDEASPGVESVTKKEK